MAAEPPSVLRTFASMSLYQMFVQPTGMAALGAAVLAADSRLKVIRPQAIGMGIVMGGSAGLMLGFMQSYFTLFQASKEARR